MRFEYSKTDRGALPQNAADQLAAVKIAIPFSTGNVVAHGIGGTGGFSSFLWLLGFTPEAILACTFVYMALMSGCACLWKHLAENLKDPNALAFFRSRKGAVVFWTFQLLCMVASCVLVQNKLIVHAIQALRHFHVLIT